MVPSETVVDVSLSPAHIVAKTFPLHRLLTAQRRRGQRKVDIQRTLRDEPFPRANDAAGFQNRIEGDLDREGLIALVNITILVFGIIGLGYFCVRFV